jgi:putative ABC transport system ATP-binding protein
MSGGQLEDPMKGAVPDLVAGAHEAEGSQRLQGPHGGSLPLRGRGIRVASHHRQLPHDCGDARFGYPAGGQGGASINEGVVIAVRGVTKVFEEGRQRVPVLKGISLEVCEGEVVALEGPSGSGKTTLLSIMGCILTPSDGEVVLDGRRVNPGSAEALRAARRDAIGFVFQQYNLFPALTARENVAYSLNVRGWRGAQAEREADRVLERVGLGERRHFLPRDLSGGQKQRVAIARALAGAPKVLLADEPTANLDSKVGAQVLELFRDLARSERKALVIVTHDHKVRDITDRVLGIEDGRLAA